jgi:hypothetical protein
MAQTGYTPISTYYTTTASAVPTAANLIAGELAININTADGKLFYKDSAGVVQTLASRETASGSFTNLAYTGTLTGGTGVVNLGSGQFYKDASGNVGIGTTSTAAGVLNMYSTGASTARAVLTGTTNYSVFQSKNSGGDFYFGIDNSTGSGFNSGAYGRVIYSGNGSYPTVFFTNDLERMRITGGGDVGIGTNSPSGPLDVVSNTFGVGIRIRGRASDNLGYLNFVSNAGSDYSYIGTPVANALAFYTNGYNERMRIDSNGNVQIGTNTPSGLSARSLSTGYVYGTIDLSAAGVFQAWNQATSGDNNFITFYTEGGGGTFRGNINFNRVAGLTAYNTTSDYRSKDIIGSVLDSGEVIDSVPVYMGKMKDATQARPMFIAHETPSYAHTGIKDAVDKDGKPVYQQMDASSLVPVLWAEVQSLRKRLAILESK